MSEALSKSRIYDLTHKQRQRDLKLVIKMTVSVDLYGRYLYVLKHGR